jgi:hypothetical protein
LEIFGHRLWQLKVGHKFFWSSNLLIQKLKTQSPILRRSNLFLVDIHNGGNLGVMNFFCVLVLIDATNGLSTCINMMPHTKWLHHVGFNNLNYNCVWQLFSNCYKCATNPTTMLQLVYDVHTCNYATCLHFHHTLIWDSFKINSQLWFPFIQLVGPLMHHYWTTNVQLCCNDCATTYYFLKVQIHM